MVGEHVAIKCYSTFEICLIKLIQKFENILVGTDNYSQIYRNSDKRT